MENVLRILVLLKNELEYAILENRKVRLVEINMLIPYR